MIKTTQKSAVRAYHTIVKLSNEPLPLPVSYKLFKLKKKLSPHFEFQSEQEVALIEQLHAKYDDGGWVFETDEDRDTFIAKIKEINEMDIEVDIDPEKLPLGENLMLSISDMEALADFIEFE